MGTRGPGSGQQGRYLFIGDQWNGNPRRVIHLWLCRQLCPAGVHRALRSLRSAYLQRLLKLFAPSARPRAESVLSNPVQTLQSWLSAQLISMTVVGVLTGLGLWFIGIPLALVLGLIAGLLAFVPNLGSYPSDRPIALCLLLAPYGAKLEVLFGGGFRVPSGVRKPFMQEPTVCTC